jgi:hypothetical protein
MQKKKQSFKKQLTLGDKVDRMVSDTPGFKGLKK